VLIHEVADEIGRARWPARPFALFVSGDQTRLRLEPGNVGRIIRLPEPVYECACASSASLSIKISVASISHGLRIVARLSGATCRASQRNVSETSNHQADVRGTGRTPAKPHHRPCRSADDGHRFAPPLRCDGSPNYCAATSSSVGHFFISTRCSNFS
jgi:hypothetical protein